MMNQMWGWGLLWLLFLAVLIAGVVLLVRALSERGSAEGSGSSALRILEERFARGEIDREEFEEKRRTLGS